MKVGDVVRPSDGVNLRCGSNQYSSAVVVSVDPIVLVSRCQTMKWHATIQDREFDVIGTVSQQELEDARKRLND